MAISANENGTYRDPKTKKEKQERKRQLQEAALN
jgi:hypothetical protein